MLHDIGPLDEPGSDQQEVNAGVSNCLFDSRCPIIPSSDTLISPKIDSESAFNRFEMRAHLLKRTVIIVRIRDKAFYQTPPITD